MAIPLLRTKFYIPPTQPVLVHRPRLTDLINAGLTRRLTLVSAPPGFGKTTLLSEWIPTSERCVAWLSIEDGDNDPNRFWNYFIAAIQTLQEQLAGDSRSLLHAQRQQTEPAQFEAVITALLNDISDFPEEFALVLDDYHQINNPAIHSGMSFLVDHLPPRMHVILACRADPPLPLSRLRARGELIELRSEDLRFTSEEAEAFLNQMMNLKLTDEQIATLEVRTEGWIVGLQLAAISMQHHEDIAHFIESFAGSHRFVLDYLMDEVLNRTPEDIQAFLLKTSILKRFTGALCDSITDTGDGQEMLRQLEQANLFIMPLDVERRWYRYHHLFADLLRRRLQELMPHQIQNLHQRACEWFEREGLLPEAIDHAIAMRDFEVAARLIERVTETQRQLGEIATLTGWVNALPQDVLRSHPALCLGYARALADTAQNLTIESLIADAEASLDRERFATDGYSDSLRGQAAALRAYLAMIRHQYADTIEHSRRAQAFLGQGETRWRSFVDLILAGAYRFGNDWDAAAATYLEASDLSHDVGDMVNALMALGLRGEVLEAQGHLHEAAAQFEHVLQHARAHAMETAPVTGYALVGLARTAYEWNDLEAADGHAQAGLECGRKANIQDVYLRGCLALARIRIARGDLETALEALDNAEPAVHQIGMAEIRDWIQAVRVQVWLAQDEPEEAIAWAASYAGGLNDTVYPSIAIALSKARLMEGKTEMALGLLEHALQSARAVGRLGNAVQILNAKVSIQLAHGSRDSALSTLSEALSLAAPEGYVRAFLDEGEPMHSLLLEFQAGIKSRSRAAGPHNQRTLFDYTDQLLSAFARSGSARDSIVSPLLGTIPDPLTERELEVLRLMVAGLSNRDIADKDIVSINTVKTQVKSIYGKLGVHSRGDALVAAHALGLL